ncbi:hypothetical protein [Sphingobacterium sp. BIGb0116]|uniref:hypothetical protein n=1 Tax=Sphingobacterium sp. BIGb0116 TaxID=2940619 RepID=UPI00216818F8|nr:hypothetical protein [Sphingobacterium sp. BIGb0116]MCS4163308.1 hypothetical protein [Sphingobacterium sp. BIGb0116]
MMLVEALEKYSKVHVRALLHGCSFGRWPSLMAGTVTGSCTIHMKNLKIVVSCIFLYPALEGMPALALSMNSGKGVDKILSTPFLL